MPPFIKALSGRCFLWSLVSRKMAKVEILTDFSDLCVQRVFMQLALGIDFPALRRGERGPYQGPMGGQHCWVLFPQVSRQGGAVLDVGVERREGADGPFGHMSLELCAVICQISPMALYRLICRLGQQSVVTVLTRCGLPLPSYSLADEKHRHCLTDKVYLPTIVCGRVIWHLGYTENASAAALTQSYSEFQRAASRQEPTYRVRGILTDGFDSTTRSMQALFPGVRLGYCLRHALIKLPGKLTAIASPVRMALRAKFHTLLHRSRQRKGLRVFALGQRLRHFADHVAATAGITNGERVRRWVQDKKAGWYAVLADPQMPVTSTLLDQAHNAIERKLFAMKGFHHPSGSQQAFLTGLAHLYNLVPYQRRAQHAGQSGVEVEGGKVPTCDWLLNLQILTSGGFR
jgi:hypothetical protein